VIPVELAPEVVAAVRKMRDRRGQFVLRCVDDDWRLVWFADGAERGVLLTGGDDIAVIIEG